MNLSDFDYVLPPELVAEQPLPDRAASRLLRVQQSPFRLHDGAFRDVLSLLSEGDVIVFNDTRVMRARLMGHKDSGGAVEVLIERVDPPALALAQVRASKAPKPGSRLALGREGQCHVEVISRAGEFFQLRFLSGSAPQDIERHGALPLPPYIRHTPTTVDETRYQTVYAKQIGAVAAPTAGLHFDADLLAALRENGVTLAFVTLHVGAGTFSPVRTEDISHHRMHREWYEVPSETAVALDCAVAAGKRVWAVGTTSLRTLESAALKASLTGISTGASGVPATRDETDLFVTPGFTFRVVDRLITNFHLPKSTLMMLVSAFAGYDEIRTAYRHAIHERYRFFSYGDAMLLERKD